MSGFARFQRNRGRLVKRLDDISNEDTFHTNGLSISMHTHGDYDLQTFVDIRPLTPSPVPDVAQLFSRVKSEESALDIEFVESPSWKYVARRTRSDGLVQTQQMLKLHANDCNFDSKLLKDNARGSIVVDWPMDNDADNTIVISAEDGAKANGSLLSNDSGLGEIELESRAPPQSSDATTYKECHSDPAFKRTIHNLAAKFEAVCLWLEFELEESKDEPATSFKEVDLLVKDFVDGRIPKLASRSSSGLIQEIAGRAFDLYAASNRPAKKTVDDYWVDVVYRVFLWDKKYQRGLVDRSDFRKLVSKEVGRTRTVTDSGKQRDKPAEQSTSLAGVQDRADASVIECIPSSSKSSQSSISEKAANRLPDGKEDFLSALTAGMDTIKKKLKETDGIAGNGDRIRKTTAKRSRMDATRSQRDQVRTSLPTIRTASRALYKDSMT